MNKKTKCMAGYLEGQTVKKIETEMDDILVYM